MPGTKKKASTMLQKIDEVANKQPEDFKSLAKCLFESARKISCRFSEDGSDTVTGCEIIDNLFFHNKKAMFPCLALFQEEYKGKSGNGNDSETDDKLFEINDNAKSLFRELTLCLANFLKRVAMGQKNNLDSETVLTSVDVSIVLRKADKPEERISDIIRDLLGYRLDSTYLNNEWPNLMAPVWKENNHLEIWKISFALLEESDFNEHDCNLVLLPANVLFSRDDIDKILIAKGHDFSKYQNICIIPFGDDEGNSAYKNISELQERKQGNYDSLVRLEEPIFLSRTIRRNEVSIRTWLIKHKEKIQKRFPLNYWLEKLPDNLSNTFFVKQVDEQISLKMIAFSIATKAMKVVRGSSDALKTHFSEEQIVDFYENICRILGKTPNPSELPSCFYYRDNGKPWYEAPTKKRLHQELNSARLIALMVALFDYARNGNAWDDAIIVSEALKIERQMKQISKEIGDNLSKSILLEKTSGLKGYILKKQLKPRCEMDKNE